MIPISIFPIDGDAEIYPSSALSFRWISQSPSWRISEQVEMPFWWPLIVLAFAYAICKFLLMLIPPNVPSIDVDASDGISFLLCLYQLLVSSMSIPRKTSLIDVWFLKQCWLMGKIRRRIASSMWVLRSHHFLIFLHIVLKKFEMLGDLSCWFGLGLRY